MATSQRGDRRTQPVDLPGLTGPKVSTVTPVDAPVPNVVAPTSGIEILSKAFDSFFRQASQGLEAVAEAERYAKNAELKDHLDKGKTQAVADALAGKPMDPERSSDESYIKAYQNALGGQHGHELQAKWFEEVYAQAKPGDNLSQMTDEFLKSNWGPGTGNADYDAAALTSFKAFTNRAHLHHQENSVKSLIATGLQTQDANVAAALRSGSLTAADMPNLIRKYQDLDPMNPAQAPLRLAQAVIEAANDGNPGTAQSVLALLSKPGSGVNGKSYAESNPAGYAAIEQKLNAAVINGNSLEGTMAWTKLFDDSLAPGADLVEMRSRARSLFDRFGGIGKKERWDSHFAGLLEKTAAREVGINKLGEMMRDPSRHPVDPEVVNKFWKDALDRVGVDPYQEPEKAAVMFSQFNMVPTELKMNMSRLMVSGDNLAGMDVGYRFYRGIQDRYSNPAMAEAHMSDDTTRGVYRAVEDLRRTQGDGALPQIFAQIGQNLDSLKDINKISWASLTGTRNETEAERTVDSALTKALQGTWTSDGVFAVPGWFNDESVRIDPLTLSQLRDTTKTSMVIRGRSGTTGILAATDEAIRSAAESGQLEVLPGEGFTAQVRFKNFPDVGRDGKSLVPLSPTAPNPSTGRTENTIATYRNDLGEIGKILPDLFVAPSEVSVARSPWGTGEPTPGSEGAYILQHRGSPIMVMPGQTVRIGKEAVKLGATFDEIKKQLPDVEGFTLINPFYLSEGFWIGYKPRLTETAPDREKERQKVIDTPPRKHGLFETIWRGLQGDIK